ncbi:hypothetical protein T484DRAFT_3575410 [Baffinella frigidus]|nr:hypothetical protein T484DRAFT_3575410 [Cryptophyta sp. CCMP2293]
MHDDLFVIIEELVLGTPRPVLAGFFVILASLILTWIKQGADERERLRRHKVEHAVLPEVCTFPLCGASLEGVGKEERVFGSHSDLPYCSKMCVKRDWKENNHASVVLLLKRRAAALEKERNAHAEASARPWLDQLADVIPNPQAGLSAAGGGVNSWVDTMSMKMEADAASLTARTFSSAYMRRFGPAVHTRRDPIQLDAT